MTRLEQILSTGTLILVNADHPLDREPEAEELLSVERSRPGIQLHARAKVMLDQLFQAAGAAGAVVPVSGYRTREEQQRIWDESLSEHGLDFTRTYVARPGCSEHQTGLAIDLGENVPGLDFIRPSFPDSGACRALRLKAADHGFVLRYPKGKQAVTGIGYEPWHFRYVGWPHARIMAERELVLEEYLEWLQSFPVGGGHLWYQAAGRSFELCHVRAEDVDGLDARLPAGIPCQCSGTNAGGAVITLWRDAG